MTSTNARFTLWDIYLNVETTPLPYLNTDVQSSITKQLLRILFIEFYYS